MPNPRFDCYDLRTTDVSRRYAVVRDPFGALRERRELGGK
jgi:hypothetical protein